MSAKKRLRPRAKDFKEVALTCIHVVEPCAQSKVDGGHNQEQHRDDADGCRAGPDKQDDDDASDRRALDGQKCRLQQDAHRTRMPRCGGKGAGNDVSKQNARHDAQCGKPDAAPKRLRA